LIAALRWWRKDWIVGRGHVAHVTADPDVDEVVALPKAGRWRLGSLHAAVERRLRGR
jgi:hypothetical protein